MLVLYIHAGIQHVPYLPLSVALTVDNRTGLTDTAIATSLSVNNRSSDWMTFPKTHSVRTAAHPNQNRHPCPPREGRGGTGTQAQVVR
jgi:hypothetical protein